MALLPPTPDVNNLLPRLQRWYLSNCDGDWEHTWGVKIETLDNPGWSVKINLHETRMAGVEFKTVQRGAGFDRPDAPDNRQGSWIACRVVDNTFEGFGGPDHLAEIIATFLTWAEQN